MKKRFLIFTLISVLVLSLTGCKSIDKGDNSSNKNNKVIVVGATANPHAQILEKVRPLLEKKGYKLRIKVFSDFVLPNTALNEGSLDANFFQHIPYLNETNKEKGYKLTYTVKVHIEPLGLYSKKFKRKGEINNGAVIAVPNDPTNYSRALNLLAKNGVIKVKNKELITKNDIIENKKNIKIKEMNAEQLPTVLKDVDGAIINTNYVLKTGLNPTKDSIMLEDKNSPYANVLACRENNKNSEKIKVLSKVLNSKEVKTFIQEKYKGSIVPAF